jgi:hypothetical protein
LCFCMRCASSFPFCCLQGSKGNWPHVFFGIPPFDHTSCSKGFDYKTEDACPVANSTGATSVDMYNRIASYAHSILERWENHQPLQITLKLPPHVLQQWHGVGIV